MGATESLLSGGASSGENRECVSKIVSSRTLPGEWTHSTISVVRRNESVSKYCSSRGDEGGGPTFEGWERPKIQETPSNFRGKRLNGIVMLERLRARRTPLRGRRRASTGGYFHSLVRDEKLVHNKRKGLLGESRIGFEAISLWGVLIAFWKLFHPSLRVVRWCKISPLLIEIGLSLEPLLRLFD